MNRKLIVLLAVFALAGSTAFAQTATKYFVAHQGGYVAAATVTVGKSGEVIAAAIEEWQGPGGWAENNSPKGDAIVDGAVVRVADPFANLGSKDPEVKGYTFYIYNDPTGKGPGVWSQFTPGATVFAVAFASSSTFRWMAVKSRKRISAPVYRSRGSRMRSTF